MNTTVTQDASIGDTRPVYFTEARIDKVDNPRRIDVVRGPGGEPPEDMLALLDDINATARMVVALFARDPERRKQFFEGLDIATTSGLVGPHSSVSVGRRNLNQVKSNLVEEFPAARDRLWTSYFISLLIMLLICLPIGGAIFYASLNGHWNVPKPDAKGTFDAVVIGALALFWIPVGAAFGIFLEFIFSVDRQIPFEGLSTINPARWRPGQQLINIVLTAWVFAFVMAVNAFQIGVMAVLLNDFASTKPYLSFLVGFITGFAFPYVRDILYKLKPTVRGAAAP